MPRKKPFSGKQKKAQLQEKKKRKQFAGDDSSENESASEETVKVEQNSNEALDSKPDDIKVQSVNQQPADTGQTFNPNRYRLQFLQESNSELKKNRELGRHPLQFVSEEDLEITESEETFIDIAKRPPWNYWESVQELERNENKYFQNYLENIFKLYEVKELSYFELNLETWRQLWRVTEMSDVLLMIVDIRYPMLHFSPALYHHVVDELGKHAILVLNKVDLVEPELVIAWKEYFLSKYPKLHIACFTSYPTEAVTNRKPGKDNKKRKRRGGRFTKNVGAYELLEICENIVQNHVDLSPWRHKIEAEGEMAESTEEVTHKEEEDTRVPSTNVRFKNGILTIGCVGCPNVGKSSLLNGLKGRKVVSVSRTPGHTKHFQTIFLSPTVKLCDCPGLVFPSKVDKALQVLAGMYPIAQIREPFSAIRYLAERVDVIKILYLKHPDPDSKFWSPYDICEAWAFKRGLLTAKAGRPDIHRASNMILRMGLDGRLCLATRPPGFTKNRDIWKTHRDTKHLIERLSQFEEIDEGSDVEEETDDEFDNEKDIDDEETQSDEDKDVSLTDKNPFSLLADD